jgi:hypothetical protein
MFRDHAQASRAIRLLLADDALERLWHETGPTNAILLRFERDLHLPASKQALLLAAWSLWTPIAPSIPFGELVRTLDGAACEELLSLVVAYKTGADAVDTWIDAAAAKRGDEGEAAPSSDAGSIFEGWPTLEDMSLRYAQRVLDHTNGNRTRAAAMLGVDRRTVGRLIGAARRHRAHR